MRYILLFILKMSTWENHALYTGQHTVTLKKKQTLSPSYNSSALSSDIYALENYIVCFIMLNYSVSDETESYAVLGGRSSLPRFYIFFPSLISRHTKDLTIEEYRSFPYLLLMQVKCLAFEPSRLKSKYFTAQIKHEK